METAKSTDLKVSPQIKRVAIDAIYSICAHCKDKVAVDKEEIL